MSPSAFRPGFRLSRFDLAILVAGLAGSLALGALAWWAGMIVGFVVLHFFLFCNVFRISRLSELIWAATFVILASATLFTGFPGWSASSGLAVALSSFLIWRATKRPDYHGICWKRWNPALPAWWEARDSNGDR